MNLFLIPLEKIPSDKLPPQNSTCSTSFPGQNLPWFLEKCKQKLSQLLGSTVYDLCSSKFEGVFVTQKSNLNQQKTVLILIHKSIYNKTIFTLGSIFRKIKKSQTSTRGALLFHSTCFPLNSAMPDNHFMLLPLVLSVTLKKYTHSTPQ